MPDAATVFAGMSALTEIIQLALDFRKRKEEAYKEHARPPCDFDHHPLYQPDKFFPAGTPRLRRRQVPDDILRAAWTLDKITSIDDEILEVVVKNIIGFKTRLKQALDDPTNTNQAKDGELRIAQCSICAELKRLMNMYGGRALPHHKFEQLWVENHCAPTVVT